MADSSLSDSPLLRTPLHALHVSLGARMVPFAGYDMPVQYPSGILSEHLHTRSHAGLFDVSHMGQAILRGPLAAARLETLVPGDILALDENRIRYTQFLDADGHILDDLMVTRLAPAPNGDERLFLVVNAGTKVADEALLRARLADLQLDMLTHRALLALQGPRASAVLARHFPQTALQPFMSMAQIDSHWGTLYVSRSGYTGEDGFEISVEDAKAEDFARALLADPDVKPIGLGARDSLRLEAGLCLYGHDIDLTTTPVEADLLWSISRRRRETGGFPGDSIVQAQIANGPPRKRVGLIVEGRAPAREGCEIVTADGVIVGRVTSGGFAPSLGHPIAMGYVAAASAAPGVTLAVLVRGKPVPARMTKMPFTPQRYFRS